MFTLYPDAYPYLYTTIFHCLLVSYHLNFLSSEGVFPPPQ